MGPRQGEALSQSGELIPEAGGRYEIIRLFLHLLSRLPDSSAESESWLLSSYDCYLSAIHFCFFSAGESPSVATWRPSASIPISSWQLRGWYGTSPSLPVSSQFLSEWDTARIGGSSMGQPSSCGSKASRGWCCERTLRRSRRTL